MSRNQEFLFPTFVLVFILTCSSGFSSLALGAKITPSPDFDTPQKTQAPEGEPQNKVDPLTRDTLDISRPPPSKEPYPSQKEYFYPYRQAIGVRLGQTFSSAATNDTSAPILAGIEYEFMTEERKTYEAGADLISDGTGSLSFAKRWIYTRSRLRPYSKAGGGLLVRPADGLASLVNFTNFRLDGAAGAEYLVYKSQSVRGELEAAISTKALVINGTLGYVWAW